MISMLIMGLVFLLLGVLPVWQHSKTWGYFPTGGVVLALLIVIILAATGHM